MPTSRATRVTSDGERVELVHHRVDRVLQLENLARASTVIFCDRSPLATAVVTLAMFRTWLVRLAAMKLTLSVRSFHVPADAATLRLPAQLAFGAHFPGDAGDLRGERVELIHHRVDGVLQLQNLAAASTVIFCESGRPSPRPWSPRRCFAPGR